MSAAHWSPRAEWDAVPYSVRCGIEEILGAKVVTAQNQTGGFSPGLAARVRCADGSRAFVKARTIAEPGLSGHTPPLAAALAMAGVGDGGALPERMAPVLAALQALPGPLAARLLPEVVSGLYR